MHATPLTRALVTGAALVVLAALAGCGSQNHADEALGTKAALQRQHQMKQRQAAQGLPGMPPVLDPADVYAADRPNRLSPVVKDFPSRVYVPNTNSNTVSVIDPKTYRVTETIPVGVQPQHVVPSWDLKTLWVNNDRGNTLTPIDPKTGRPASRSTCTTRTTCTSRPTASTRSSWPRSTGNSCSATRTR